MTGVHVLFVESNTTGTGALAVSRLLAAGARVTFLARQPEKYPVLAGQEPGLAVEVMDTNDVEAVHARVVRARAGEGVSAILTFSEFYVAIVAEVAARCGLRYLSPAAARSCRSKPETRRRLRAAGRRTPGFRLVASEEEARRVAAEIGYPCIVKPPADSSSKGVRQVGGEGELLDHFRQLHAWRTNDRGQRVAGEVLIESLLEGPEFSVETVTRARGETQVVGITAKHLSPPPRFVELGHDFPAPLSAEWRGGLEEEALAALAAVEFDFGPAHTEVRWTRGGPVVVEINPRLAGGMIPELVRHALGVDLLDAFLIQLLGRPVDLAPRRAEFASIRFLTAGRAGTLGGVSGLAAARQRETVREATITKPLGAAVRPAEEAGDRIGFVIASGADRAAVLRDVDAAKGDIRLDVEAGAANP